MLLKERDWSLPLEALDSKFDECYNVTAEKFHIARSDFLREWHFLEILWERLQNDWKCFNECRSRVMGAIKNGRRNHVKMESTSLIRSFDILHLDTNCFFQNAKTLMDRLAYLTKFFWEEISIQQIHRKKFDSFERLKNKIKTLHEKGEIIDKIYAEYVIQNTDWFDNELRKTRVDLIVHRKGWYVDAMKDNPRALLRGKAVFRDKDGKTIVEYDSQKLPDLNKLMDGMSDFLDFFDKHFSQTL